MKYGVEHRWPEQFLQWLETVCPPSTRVLREAAVLDSFSTKGKL